MPVIREPYTYSGSLKRIQPSVPRQSGLVKISKLGMFVRRRRPSGAFAERQPQVDVVALDVEAIDRQRVEPAQLKRVS